MNKKGQNDRASFILKNLNEIEYNIPGSRNLSAVIR